MTENAGATLADETRDSVSEGASTKEAIRVRSLMVPSLRIEIEKQSGVSAEKRMNR
jgi:hypothetical protein